MPLHTIRRVQTVVTTYEVEANNPDEAIVLAESGKAEEIDYQNNTEWEIE